MGAEDSRERMISNEFRLILIATCYMIMVFVSSGVYSLKHPLEHQITLTMIQRWIRFAHMKTMFKWILCAVQLQKRTWGYVKRNFLVEKYRRWYHSSPFETNEMYNLNCKLIRLHSYANRYDLENNIEMLCFLKNLRQIGKTSYYLKKIFLGIKLLDKWLIQNQMVH